MTDKLDILISVAIEKAIKSAGYEPYDFMYKLVLMDQAKMEMSLISKVYAMKADDLTILELEMINYLIAALIETKKEGK